MVYSGCPFFILARSTFVFLPDTKNNIYVRRIKRAFKIGIERN